MEEEVNQRVVTLSVNTGRMTASVLARTMSNFLAREHQALNRRAEIRKNTEPHGKMTVKELMDQNAGAESVEIEDISDPDLFELFDYKISLTSIYVDFKNWHEGMTTDKSSIIGKIVAKATKCECKCVVIANIIADSKWNINDEIVDGIRIVSIPALVSEENGRMLMNENAWHLLRECCDEYKSTNE